MKKSEHIESRLYYKNIKMIYLCFDPNLLRFSRFSSGFCPDFAPILSSKDLPRSQFFLTKDSVLVSSSHICSAGIFAPRPLESSAQNHHWDRVKAGPTIPVAYLFTWTVIFAQSWSEVGGDRNQ